MCHLLLHFKFLPNSASTFPLHTLSCGVSGRCYQQKLRLLSTQNTQPQRLYVQLVFSRAPATYFSRALLIFFVYFAFLLFPSPDLRQLVYWTGSSIPSNILFEQMWQSNHWARTITVQSPEIQCAPQSTSDGVCTSRCFVGLIFFLRFLFILLLFAQFLHFSCFFPFSFVYICLFACASYLSR